MESLILLPRRFSDVLASVPIYVMVFICQFNLLRLVVASIGLGPIVVTKNTIQSSVVVLVSLLLCASAAAAVAVAAQC